MFFLHMWKARPRGMRVTLLWRLYFAGQGSERQRTLHQGSWSPGDILFLTIHSGTESEMSPFTVQMDQQDMGYMVSNSVILPFVKYSTQTI